MPRWALGGIWGKKLPKELWVFQHWESSRDRLLSGLGHQLLWGDKCLEDTFQRCGRTGGRGERLTRQGLVSSWLLSAFCAVVRAIPVVRVLTAQTGGLLCTPCLVSPDLWLVISKGQLWGLPSVLFLDSLSGFSLPLGTSSSGTMAVLYIWASAVVCHFLSSVILGDRQGVTLLICSWEVLCKGLIFDPFWLYFSIPWCVENRVAVCSSTGLWLSVTMLQGERETARTVVGSYPELQCSASDWGTSRENATCT